MKSLPQIVQTLRKHYGPPAPPAVTALFDIVLFENAAYLVDDDRRRAVWTRLQREIGATPERILATSDAALARVIHDGGMRPPMRAEKLKKAARVALAIFKPNAAAVLHSPQVRKLLKKFPGIGAPGADRILMLTRTQPLLALESNGLRTLVRLGFGREHEQYAATYQSVQDAISQQIKRDYDWLIAAHILLRRHGLELCRNTKPLCGACPLAKACPSARRGRGAV